MDRQTHEYSASMAFAQQQQQQQFSFHPQPQQFPHQVHAPPFLPPHSSLQQIPPFHRHVPPQQQQLYPHHHHPLLHLQQQQQPPPAFAPHPPSHLMPPSPYMHPFDSSPPPAAPPSDPELQKRTDRIMGYAAKNGPEFEAMIHEKQHDNPAYSFLYSGEGHNYYRYKLWLSTWPPRSAFNPPFPSSSMPMMPSSHNPMLNPSPLTAPPMGAGGAPDSMIGTPQLHQLYPPYYNQHQPPPHPQSFMGQARSDYDAFARSFKGLSGLLPSDVAAELNNVLTNLTGTKESIKGAKMWFTQRSPFAPALAEALRDRIFALDDSERQLHIIFLANDILFDSLKQRVNPQDLDNEALAFKPVLGSMLARIYNNPHNKDSNQSCLEKILQFWASKEVYDRETIASLENEMTGGAPLGSTTHREASDPSGLQHIPQQWHSDGQNSSPGSLDQLGMEKQLPSASPPPSQFSPSLAQQNQLPAGVYQHSALNSFPGSVPIESNAPIVTQPPRPNLPPTSAANITTQTPPPYPLFPSGLIPGMVRKMQIGSGVPYSPMNPLDIPTAVPLSTVPQPEILDRVSKFFQQIGEANPSGGPIIPSESKR